MHFERLHGCTRRTVLLAATALGTGRVEAAQLSRRVPILAYHRFAATTADSMTIRLTTFSAHVRVLEELGCHVAGMDEFLVWQARLGALPERSIVLTADDGHRSQFEHMAPLLRTVGWPVTLFVYPSAISNASYAMTWEQLATLRDSGRFRIESHTYWHPNFMRERQRMTPQAFRSFAADQLERSRARLEEKLGTRVTLLAWPFGLADDALAAQARDAGYSAAFSLGNRAASAGDDRYQLPRYLATEALGPALLRRILLQAWGATA